MAMNKKMVSLRTDQVKAIQEIKVLYGMSSLAEFVRYALDREIAIYKYAFLNPGDVEFSAKEKSLILLLRELYSIPTSTPEETQDGPESSLGD